MKEIEFKNVLGLALIRAEADGVEGWMAFDTGAMRTTINSRYFASLEGEALKVAMFDEGMRTGGAAEVKLRKLCLGGVTARDLSVICMDVGYVETSLRTAEPELRLLGSANMEVFGNVPVLLDYGRSVLTVEPDISGEGAEALPLSVEALPVVELELGGRARRFVLDTGANTCLLASGLAGEIEVTPLEDSQGVYVVPKISAGRHEFTDVNAVFTDISHIRAQVEADGVIGYQILSPQLSLIDFPNGALRLY